MRDTFRFERMRQMDAGRAAYAVIPSLVCMIVSCGPSQPAGGGTSTTTTTTQPTFHPMDEGDVLITITGGSLDLDFDPDHYPGTGTTADPFKGSGSLAGIWVCDDTKDKGSSKKEDPAICWPFPTNSGTEYSIQAEVKKNEYLTIFATPSGSRWEITIDTGATSLRRRFNDPAGKNPLRRRLYDKDTQTSRVIISENKQPTCCDTLDLPANGKITVVLGVHR